MNAIRYNFKSMIEAKKAVNDCHNIGYWAVIVLPGRKLENSCIVECSPLAAGLIESRYKNYIG